MVEPFKNLINAEVVQAIGHHLQRVDAGLDRRGFEAARWRGWTRWS